MWLCLKLAPSLLWVVAKGPTGTLTKLTHRVKALHAVSSQLSSWGTASMPAKGICVCRGLKFTSLKAWGAG